MPSPAPGSSSHAVSAKSPCCLPQSVTLHVLFLPTPAHPCPRAFAGLPVLWAQTQTPVASAGTCTPPRVTCPPTPPPWQEGSGPEPLPSARVARVAREGAGDCLCTLCSRSLDCDSTRSCACPQGGGHPESAQSPGARLLVKRQPPALQAPRAVCPGGVPDPIAQPQPEVLLPAPGSCDTGSFTCNTSSLGSGDFCTFPFYLSGW